MILLASDKIGHKKFSSRFPEYKEKIKYIPNFADTSIFVKIDKATNGRLSVAYYNVSDRTYPSVLPSEKLFKSKMYHTEKQCRVRLNRKRNCVYDKYAFATCIIGLLASVTITGAVIFLAYQVNSVQG